MTCKTYTLEKYMIGRGIYEPEVVLKEDGAYQKELIGDGAYYINMLQETE